MCAHVCVHVGEYVLTCMQKSEDNLLECLEHAGVFTCSRLCKDMGRERGCEYARGGQRSTSGVIPEEPFILFFGGGSLTETWSSLG